MGKFSLIFAFTLLTLLYQTMAGPIEVEKSADDDLKTAETFGYGYYQPGVYSAPLVASGVPFAATGAIAAPLTTTAALSSSGYARSGYGYNSGYKYGGYGGRWGYGTGTNEFYRRHPVYVAWG